MNPAWIGESPATTLGQVSAKQLNIPHTQSNLVPCPRLIERLAESLGPKGKLTLASFPAGFGKMIETTDRSHQKAKYGTMNNKSYEALTPHTPFRGDKV